MFGAYGGIAFTVLGGPTKSSTENAFHFGKLEVIGAPPTSSSIRRNPRCPRM